MIRLEDSGKHFKESIEKSHEVLQLKVGALNLAYLESLLVYFLNAENLVNLSQASSITQSFELSSTSTQNQAEWLKNSADNCLYSCGMFILFLDKKIMGSELPKQTGKFFYKKLGQLLEEAGEIYISLEAEFDNCVEILNYIAYSQVQNLDKDSLDKIYARYKNNGSPAAKQALLDLEIDLNSLEKKLNAS